LFLNHRAKLVAPASGAGVPAIYPYREVTQADGLLSYGTNIADIVRQAGVMAGKVLKGAKPADLPVQAPTKYELETSRRRRRSAWMSRQCCSHVPTR